MQSFIEVADHMGFAIFSDKERCRIPPFVLDFVILETFGDRIHLSSQL